MAFERSRFTNHFGDPVGEASACRQDCAVFDFSFLECARLQGPGARAAVEAYAERPLDRLQPGAIAYAVRSDTSGAAVVDLTIWRTGVDAFEVMSGRQEDIATLMACASTQVEAANVGADRAVFALQGPGALDALRSLGNVDAIALLAYFHFAQADLAGVPCTVGRLGYTGEAGFEIIVTRSAAVQMWNELSRRARPAGFIAADALRIEAGFVLFANEFRVPVTPGEAGLAQFHIERSTGENPVRLACFRAQLDQLSLPWVAQGLLARPTEPGLITITSACRSVAANAVLGLGFVTTSTPDAAILRDPSGQFGEIERVPLPFYDTLKRRPRQPWR
ncbi:MAG TPA: hypothetical protein VFB45_19510 [Pseudolabrys sp.]|nr:hypothetical protein [Pseudolabrys sp.]